MGPAVQDLAQPSISIHTVGLLRIGAGIAIPALAIKAGPGVRFLRAGSQARHSGSCPGREKAQEDFRKIRIVKKERYEE